MWLDIDQRPPPSSPVPAIVPGHESGSVAEIWPAGTLNVSSNRYTPYQAAPGVMTSFAPILAASVSKIPTGEATLAAIRASSIVSTRVQLGALRSIRTLLG